MSRENESAPAAGHSQRHVNNSSAKPIVVPGRPPVEKLALRPAAAAEALDVSRDFFAEHVAPELRGVRRGRIVLYAVCELQNWLDACAARTLEEGP